MDKVAMGSGVSRLGIILREDGWAVLISSGDHAGRTN